MYKPPTSLELAWCAGLFEGEGTICFANKTILVSINMTDEDVLRKFFKIIRCGYLNGPYKARKSTHKPSWHWRLQGGEWAQTVISMFWPWLCSRRKSQFAASMTKWKEIPAKNKVFCSRGHKLEIVSFSGESSGARGCRTCVNARRRALRLLRIPSQRNTKREDEYQERPKRNRRINSV